MTDGPAKRFLTAVDLEYSAEEFNYRLIFGRPVDWTKHVTEPGRTVKTAWFEPGSLFGLDLWEGALIENAAGDRRTRTRARGCFVLRASSPGDEITLVQQVRPGARVLIHTRGVRRSKYLLAWIEELSKRCDPCAVDADFYELKSVAVSVLVPERDPPAAIGFPMHVTAH